MVTFFVRILNSQTSSFVHTHGGVAIDLAISSSRNERGQMIVRIEPNETIIYDPAFSPVLALQRRRG
jgi:hypothetical protein